MSRFSVKKPYTVIVGVLIVLIMGYMAFTNLSTDLLPSMDLPYALVMTTYVGGSPEEVEEIVTKPIESSMATISNIKHVSSTSSENYSMVVLEFNNDANMDSATIEMRESLDMLGSYWPDAVGNPIIMKMNPNMLPVMMLAVSGEGMEIGEISRLVSDTVEADLESIDGVASVSASGLLNETIQVIIREDKVEALNQKMIDQINGEFDEAQAELDSGRQELENGKAALTAGEQQANAKLAQAQAQIDSGRAALDQGQAELNTKKAEMETAKAQLDKGQAQLDALPDQLAQLEDQLAQVTQGKEQLELVICGLEKAAEVAEAALEAAHSEAAGEKYQQLLGQKAELEQQIAQVSGDSSLSEEDKNAKLAELNGKLQMVNDGIAAIDYGVTEAENILNDINSQLVTYRDQYAQAVAGEEALLAGKAQLEAAIAGSAQAQAQIDEGRAALAQGEAALGTAQGQINSGRSQLDNAQNQLTVGQAEAKNQMAAARNEIAQGEAALDEAQTQMDAAKEEALDAVHMEEILTTDMIKGILTAENFSMPAGYVTEDGASYMIRVGDKLTSLEETKNLMLLDLSEQGLDPVYLCDVADVIVTDNSDEIYAKMDGENAVLLSVEKQTGYSTADVARALREYMASEKVAGYGLTMTALMDQGIYIDMVIESVLSNLVVGGILAIIILIFFLKDIKPTAVVAISIPVSVVFAMALMYFTGVTMNIISLSGLALGVGMLVDNSIVVIENIYRLRNLGVPAKKAAIQGARQVVGAIVASTLTTICIWVPIIFVEGMTKQLFMDLVLTIAYSLLASLIVAMTVVPMMSSRILDKAKVRKHPLFDRICNIYGKALAWSLRFKAVVILASIILFIVSAVGILSQGMEFMGDMDSTQISVNIAMTDEDSTMEDVSEAADEILERVLSLEDVEHAGVMAGSNLGMMSSSSSTDPVNTATMYVILKEDKTQTSQEVAAQIEELTADVEGCEVTASGSNMDMSALGGSGLKVMVKGRDLDVLKNVANDLADVLSGIEGAVEVSNGQEDPVPELRITVDKDAAMKNGLTVAQVYQQLSKRLAVPTAATAINTDGKELDILVIDESAAAMDRSAIRNFELESTDPMTGTSKTVLLKDIAQIGDDYSLSSISRDGQQRYITVSCAIDEGYNATLVGNAFKAAAADYDLPEGCSLEFSGEDESTQEAVTELVKLLALGIVIMYLIMVAQFQSLLSPFIVLFTIPLAFTGGFFALWMTGNILSVIAMVGFVMLCGIIVNNGIVFIDYANQLRMAGAPKREALIETGKTRLRPILMTALTTILAMSTMALGIGSGSDMVQPMAIVTIGGLIYGTLMTLFVVPVIYDIFNRKDMTYDASEYEEMAEIPEFITQKEQIVKTGENDQDFI